jgi:transmembrane sensor
MKETNVNLRISTLISKKIIANLSPEEELELSEWIALRPGNKNLYQKLIAGKTYADYFKSVKHIPVDTSWRKVNSRIFGKARTLYILEEIAKYAAVLALPVVITTMLFFLPDKPQKLIELRENEEFVPANSNAVLTLADGKTISLNAVDSFKISESDGTVIQKNLTALNYMKDTLQKNEELIYNTIEVPKGGEYFLILADGTQVHLNSMSKLKYPVRFTGNCRTVELTGEAYFSVARNELPFIVTANDIRIEVFGTSFNINAYERSDFQAVTLEEGSIQIETIGIVKNKMMLQPNQQAYITNNYRSVEIREVPAYLFSSWRFGKIMFRDERLENIMDVLARWYDIHIFYQNPSLKDLRFGGSLNKYESITPILEVFELTKKVKYKLNGNTLLFYE